MLGLQKMRKEKSIEKAFKFYFMTNCIRKHCDAVFERQCVN